MKSTVTVLRKEYQPLPSKGIMKTSIISSESVNQLKCCKHNRFTEYLHLSRKELLCSKCVEGLKSESRFIMSALQAQNKMREIKKLQFKIIQKIHPNRKVIENFVMKAKREVLEEIMDKLDQITKETDNYFQQAKDENRDESESSSFSKIQDPYDYDLLLLDLKEMEFEIDKWLLGGLPKGGEDILQKYVENLINNNASNEDFEKKRKHLSISDYEDRILKIITLVLKGKLLYSKLVQHQATLLSLNEASAICQADWKADHQMNILIYLALAGHYIRREDELADLNGYLGKVLELIQSKLNENHIYMAEYYDLLALKYQNQQKWEDSNIVLQKSLEIKQSMNFESELWMTDTYHLMANYLRVKKKYQDALVFYRKSINIRKTIFGENDYKVGQNYNSFGLCLSCMENKLNEAFGFHTKALNIAKFNFGKEHPDIANAYSHIGLLYRSKNREKEALEYLEKAIDIWEKFYGVKFSRIAGACNIIGLILSEMRQNKEALAYFLQALDIKRATLGEDHPDIVHTLSNVGNTYMVLEDFPNALKYLQQTLDLKRKIYGDNHGSVGMSYYALGLLMKKMQKDRDVFRYLRTGLSICITQKGKEASILESMLFDTGLSLGNLKNFQQALNLETTAYLYNRTNTKKNPSKLEAISRGITNSCQNLAKFFNSQSLF